jgi:hypothetical protein
LHVIAVEEFPIGRVADVNGRTIESREEPIRKQVCVVKFVPLRLRVSFQCFLANQLR